MKMQYPFQGPYLPVSKSPLKTVNLVWALPITLSILFATWWFQSSWWLFGDDFSQLRINMVYPDVLKNYVLSAVIAAIPILAVNWSRTIWPRIELAALLLIAEVVAGTVLILIPRSSS